PRRCGARRSPRRRARRPTDRTARAARTRRACGSGTAAASARRAPRRHRAPDAARSASPSYSARSRPYASVARHLALDDGENRIVPAIHGTPERPHPAIRSAHELRDDVIAEPGTLHVHQPVHLGHGANTLLIPFLLEPGPEPG